MAIPTEYRTQRTYVTCENKILKTYDRLQKKGSYGWEDLPFEDRVIKVAKPEHAEWYI